MFRRVARAFVGCTLGLAFVVSFESVALGQSLSARQITPATAAGDLFGGSDALGGIDDWYLSNGLIEAIVGHVGYQKDLLPLGANVPIRDFGFTGGSLIDLARVGANNDQLSWVTQFVNYGAESAILYVPAGAVLGNAALPAVLANVDAAAGKASLTVYGFVLYPTGNPLDKKIIVETEYSVFTGDTTLHIKTTVTNYSSRIANVHSITDIVLLAHGGLLPFTPYPGRGFNIDGETVVLPYVSFVGRVEPADGMVDTAKITASGKASYTLMSPGQGLLVGRAQLHNPQPILFFVGSPPNGQQLAPSASLSYSRQIEVGRRNDVSSSLNGILSKLSPVLGIPLGAVRGRLVAPDGTPFRAAVELTLLDLNEATPVAETVLSQFNGDNRPQPISHFASDASIDGHFQAVLPVGRYELRVAAEERGDIPPSQFSVAPAALLDLGNIALLPQGRLTYRVTDADQPGAVTMPAKISIQGLNGTPNPKFGVPFSMKIEGVPAAPQGSHSNPALHMAYTLSGEGELFLRPGDYRVFASRGLEYDIDSGDISLAPGQTTHLEFSISRVVDTSGFLSADFHVHSARSADSSVPPVDRVVNFAAEGVEVIVGTEHNFVFDYRPVIESLGLSSSMTSMPGVEVTTGRSEVNGRIYENFGHWNAWPHPVEAFGRRDGGPEEAYVEPNIFMDRVRAKGAEVVQLNHPWWSSVGFLFHVGYDPALPITDGDNAFLLRQAFTGSGTRNIDFDAVELYNGTGPFGTYALSRATWFSLLNQGINKVGTAVTDTHFIALKHGGFPRSYVESSVTDMSQFDATEFNQSLKDMKAIGTSGPFITVDATSGPNTAGMGETLQAASGSLELNIRIQAACWIPVEEARIFANGVLLTRIPLAPTCPPVTRFDLSLPLSPTRDTYYVIEAGQAMGPTASDEPPLPAGAISVIEPQIRSLSFTNPIFVDVDGNGSFDPPGLDP